MILDINVRCRAAEFSLDAACRMEGPATGLFGPSGAGKTTLLHLVAGLADPADGRIALDDAVLFDKARGVSLPAHKRRVGVVFQDVRLFPHLTVRGNLRFAENLAEPAAQRTSLEAIAERLDLGPLMDRSVGRLSGGERRRVALGRAVLAAPRLLLLDEPLTGLDRRRKERVLGFLEHVRDDLAIPLVVVSHDLREILSLTDKLVFLDRGKVRGEGPLRDLLAKPRIRRLIAGQAPVSYLRGAGHTAGEEDDDEASLPPARAV
jgi:molybdate transport system ATP-binding protein